MVNQTKQITHKKNTYEFPGQVTGLKYNAEGSVLSVSDSTGKIYLFSDENSIWGEVENSNQNENSALSKSVNCMDFATRGTSSISLLSSNEKTIKLWRIGEKVVRPCIPQKSASQLLESEWLETTGNQLTLPRLSSKKKQVAAKNVKEFSGAHQYSIHSVSMSANLENFISADDLKVYLWDLNRNDTVCMLVDQRQCVKPMNEVITRAVCHPQMSNLILWASTNGTIRVGDLRSKLLCDTPSLTFKCPAPCTGFFDELMLAISSAEFCNSRNQIVSRDYFTVKLWDMRITSQPYRIIEVLDNIEKDMNELYRSQAICAKFQVKDSPKSEYCATGGYGEAFVISYDNPNTCKYELEPNSNEVLHVDIHPQQTEAALSSSEKLTRVALE